MTRHLPPPPDRAAEASPKRAAIVQAGRALLLHHGIRKTRVEEVCADARVSKRTFYRYFRDKDELAIAVLGDVFDSARARIEMLLTMERPLETTVWQILEVKAELAADTSAAFYRDVLDGSTSPGRFVLQQRQAWDDRVRRFYLDAQAHGRIRDDIDVDLLMGVLAHLRDLVNDPEAAASGTPTMRVAESLTTILLYGIIPRRPAGPTGIAVRAGVDVGGVTAP